MADEDEFVRDIEALKAGQRIVNMYADTAITLLLPQLEGGRFDNNWKIKYRKETFSSKSVEFSGKMTTASAKDDDNIGTDSG